MVKARREIGRASLAVEVDVDDPRIFPGEMVVDRCHGESSARELREDRFELGVGQHEIAHHHRVSGRSAETGPRA